MGLKLFLLLLSVYFMFNFALTASAVEEEIIIILDNSLSMSESVNGTPKYMLAAETVKQLLSTSLKGKKIGLRTIGVTLDASALEYLSKPSEMCRATRLVIPPGFNNDNNISSVLDNSFPLGVTPLVYSLKSSAESDFSGDRSALKHIILITDDGENCDADPCSYIQSAMRRDPNLLIDVITVNADNNTRSQLSCLAQYTGGKINDIKDSISPYEIVSLVPSSSLRSGLNSPEMKFNLNSLNNNSGIIYKNYLIELSD